MQFKIPYRFGHRFYKLIPLIILENAHFAFYAGQNKKELGNLRLFAGGHAYKNTKNKQKKRKQKKKNTFLNRINIRKREKPTPKTGITTTPHHHGHQKSTLFWEDERESPIPTFAPKEGGTNDPQASPFSIASDHPHIPHATESDAMDSMFLTTWEDEDGKENDDFFEDHFIGNEYVPLRSFLSHFCPYCLLCFGVETYCA